MQAAQHLVRYGMCTVRRREAALFIMADAESVGCQELYTVRTDAACLVSPGCDHMESGLQVMVMVVLGEG